MAAAYDLPELLDPSDRAVYRFCVMCQKFVAVDPELNTAFPCDPTDLARLGAVARPEEHLYYRLMLEHVAKDLQYSKCVCTQSGCDTHFVREEDLFRHQLETRHRESRRTPGTSMFDVFVCSVASRNLGDMKKHTAEEKIVNSDLDYMCENLADRLLSKRHYDTLETDERKACVAAFKAYRADVTNKLCRQREANGSGSGATNQSKAVKYETYKQPQKAAAASSKQTAKPAPASKAKSSNAKSSKATAKGGPKKRGRPAKQRSPSPSSSGSDSEYEEIVKSSRSQNTQAPSSTKRSKPNVPLPSLRGNKESSVSPASDHLPDVSDQGAPSSSQSIAASSTTSASFSSTAAVGGISFNCKRCDYKTSMKLRLKQHMKKEHGEELSLLDNYVESM